MKAMKVKYLPMVLVLLAGFDAGAQVRLRPVAPLAPGDTTMKVRGFGKVQRFQKVEAPKHGHYTLGTILDGDTVPYYQLPEVKIYLDGMLLTQKEIRQNAKLIRNVRLMRPYALEGKRRLDALEVEIASLPRKQRKAAIKAAEKKLLDDYKGELENYTFSQGLVLIKLIDRETSRTAYSIVGELRGSLRAGLYQTLAKLFGYNLKDTFDPKHNKKDDLIDRICISIERGQI